eukprot:scaffold2471_cov63-Phaeocystis_antarctica.AAC.3
MEVIVSGCRSPSAASDTSSASRYNGSASSNLPWKLETQRIAVLVPALAAAVGCVLPQARAPPLLEAAFVDPLGGAAARTRLHEWAVVLVRQAHPAPCLLHLRFLLAERDLGCRRGRGQGHGARFW